MSSRVRIRPFANSEFADIVALHHAAWHNTYAGVHPKGLLDKTDPQYFSDYWEDIIGNKHPKGWMTLVAEKDGELLGFINIGPAGDDFGLPRDGLAELHQIYLSPAAQGHGLGSLLLERAVDYLLDAGYASMQIQVDLANQGAQGFYGRFAATKATDVMVDDWRDGECYQSPVRVMHAPDLNTVQRALQDYHRQKYLTIPGALQSAYPSPPRPSLG